MTGTDVIAVTGVTGGLGGRVARRLAERGGRQRLGVRGPGRGPGLAGAEGWGGAAALFMVSASEDPDRLRLHANVVDAAVGAGVERVVYTSFYGAGPECTFTFGRDHWHTEQRILGSGLRHTFLRDNLYIDFLPLLVGADGVIRGPAGDGRVAAVTRDDIADAAVAVLLDGDDHNGRNYDITRPAGRTLAGGPDHGRGPRGAVAGHRAGGRLPARDPGGGVRVAGVLRRPRLGGRRLGDHLCRRRPRRRGAGVRRRRRPDRPPAHGPGRVPGGQPRQLPAATRQARGLTQDLQGLGHAVLVVAGRHPGRPPPHPGRGGAHGQGGGHGGEQPQVVVPVADGRPLPPPDAAGGAELVAVDRLVGAGRP